MSKFLDFELLAGKAPLFVWIYVAVIVAIMIDLITAIHYAKRSGIPIASWGLRKTVDKLVRYYGVVLMGTTIDVILYLCDVYGQLGLFTAPYATAFFAILLCAIEVKSVFEHRDPKKRKLIKKASESLYRSLTKQDAQALLTFLTEESHDENELQQLTELSSKEVIKLRKMIKEYERNAEDAERTEE